MWVRYLLRDGERDRVPKKVVEFVASEWGRRQIAVAEDLIFFGQSVGLALPDWQFEQVLVSSGR